jgi:hypothetical protein
MLVMQSREAGETTGLSRKVRTPQGESGREMRPGETRGKVPQKPNRLSDEKLTAGKGEKVR